MLSKVAPWLASAKSAEPVRVLDAEDTASLRRLVDRDPVANVFLASYLEGSGSASPTRTGALILGYFDDGELASACWAGANVVPVQVEPAQAAAYAGALARSGRRYSSIFGPANAVMSIYAQWQGLGAQALEVRSNQPLLSIAGESPVVPNPALGFGTMDEFEDLLPACVAMFEEEVGYSPFLGGEDFYRRRVAGLVQRGHSLLHLDGAGDVVFKAELGAVSQQATQVQGVWMNPRYRGRGLSAGYMAAVVHLARRYAPTTTLYVNDYNHRARATYEKVGFEQVGTFATVLF
ncbi:GNAT family N-acetyltransferase [Paenarthrobacter sp. DKR-5]|uniref:GNAT family N-acetyltransferase n=1 Tax=Paenarthrobacter sp. DKR-5 TaxID=2835535 RepID=UPI001BDBB647|nr:DUF4081 domain-containing GNAT family N-acetyltransferase [Paenarthrobacter sp. DKR-5]MBT1002682.1 GNAT family N-acetyltransferase [Paenarthrobacter sp. DKR-5]